MTPSIRVVRGSAGHILAEAFLFDGHPRAVKPKKRTGVRNRVRVVKYRRTNLLTALLHVKMEKSLAHPGRRKAKQARRLDAMKTAWQPELRLET
jgi:hypothetical protein